MKKQIYRLMIFLICALWAVILVPVAQVWAEPGIAIEEIEQAETSVIKDEPMADTAIVLPKLATPTDLRWGYKVVQFDWDPNAEIRLRPEKSVPGEVVWKHGETSQDMYKVALYRISEFGQEEYITHYTRGGQMASEYTGISFVDDIHESGDYYFTVTNLGDGETCMDSEPAKSAIWTYVKPEAQMGDCTNLTWDWPTVRWDCPDDAEYEILWYFVETADAEPEEYIGFFYSQGEREDRLADWYINYHGSGYYYVRVRALSENIENACMGEWSEMSEPYFLYPTSGTCGENLTWAFDKESGILTISGTGEMEDYTGKDAPWYAATVEAGFSVNGIRVENGVTGIGDYAFNSQTAVKEIFIPESVTRIGDYAFENCTSLQTVFVGSGVQQIGSGAFKGCSGLRSVHFLGDAPEIAGDAFWNLTATCDYRGENATWTEAKKQNYGGWLIWKALGKGEVFLVASGKTTEGPSWKLDSAGTLTISGGELLGDYRLTQAPWRWYDDNTPYRVKKVVIGHERPNVGMYAFDGLEELKRIEVGYGVVVLEPGAFVGAANLEEVEFFGYPPMILESVFQSNQKVTCYYPAGDDYWTVIAGGYYGGTVNWVARYPILEGADATIGGGQKHQIRVDGDVSRFESVSVDGETVDPANYTITEGSTIVTFHKEYLRTLGEGTHTVCVAFTDGVATTSLTMTGSVTGDLDDNGIVDDEDVIYLLWHTLMQDEYPVSQDVDYDGNGIVDDEDVIYLLWHTLMPDEYPL